MSRPSDTMAHPQKGGQKLKTVLFVCIENSCRSQMAEAFATLLGSHVIDAYSCGSKPSGKVNEKAIISMKAIAYDLSTHQSKGLEALPKRTFDLVVTMGCGDACPNISALQREDWRIPDPKAMPMQAFSEIRDLIQKKVSTLISSLEEQ